MDDLTPLIKRRKKCRINGMPDDVLIAILSHLNFHEAARTCILSRRWRYLWKYTTCSSLEFYNDNTYKIRKAERFITSVNQALKLHQGASIEQFKLLCVYPNIPKAAGGKQNEIDCAIDGWMSFAIEKQVKVFELNFAAAPLYLDSYLQSYSIPHVQKLLSFSGEVKLLRTLTTLKSVRFVRVRITQEVVEFLLSNCPLLEQVCVSASGSLENLEVVGSLPKLRSMEISNCEYLRTMKVRAPSLVSFTYIGCAMITMPFEEVPLLSKLTIGGKFALPFIFGPPSHSNYRRNLKKLKLEVPYEVFSICKKLDIPREFPQLCHLKKLELDITTKFGDGLCFFIFLIKCSPQLSRLTIRLTFLPIFPDIERHVVRGYGKYNDKFEKLLAKKSAADLIAREAMTFSHKCLKVVKLVGFIGSTSDYDLALHLLHIAGSLKKMVLCSDTCIKRIFVLNRFWPSSMRKKAIRECADHLKANLPPGAEFLTYGPGFSRRELSSSEGH